MYNEQISAAFCLEKEIYLYQHIYFKVRLLKELMTVRETQTRFSTKPFLGNSNIITMPREVWLAVRNHQAHLTHAFATKRKKHYGEGPTYAQMMHMHRNENIYTDADTTEYFI